MFQLISEIIGKILCFFLYFENNGSFPKPLSAKEEYKCFEEFNENGNIEAKNKLIEHNLRLVAHIVKKYYSQSNEQEDLISIGTIGLIKAVSTFSYKKGTRFATYASKCIENATLSQMSFWLRKELPIGELPSRRQKSGQAFQTL